MISIVEREIVWLTRSLAPAQRAMRDAPVVDAPYRVATAGSLATPTGNTSTLDHPLASTFLYRYLRFSGWGSMATTLTPLARAKHV
jgi:hypothetical protein